MKKFSDFLESKSEEPMVYVVKDREGQILSVCDFEEDAEKELKKWSKESKANEPSISKEPRKNYIKK